MRSASIALACLLAAVCCAPPAPEASSAEPPNIVVILADDLGYNDVGVYDSQFIKTPHIDQLARNGVRLTDAYVSAAVCSPSRAGLYTGRYQPRFGYEYNPTYHDAELGLPANETTLANMLKQAGYVTGLIGKWHLGKPEKYHPLNRGFDEVFGLLAGGTSYIDSRKEGVESWPPEHAPTTRSGSNAFIRLRPTIHLRGQTAVDQIDPRPAANCPILVTQQQQGASPC